MGVVLSRAYVSISVHKDILTLTPPAKHTHRGAHQYIINESCMHWKRSKVSIKQRQTNKTQSELNRTPKGKTNMGGPEWNILEWSQAK